MPKHKRRGPPSFVKVKVGLAGAVITNEKLVQGDEKAIEFTQMFNTVNWAQKIAVQHLQAAANVIQDDSFIDKEALRTSFWKE